MTLSAYEEFYASFKASANWETRKAAGKGAALDNTELAAAYKEGATLATADEFRAMVEGFKAAKLWDYGLDPGYAMYGLTRTALLDGALQSFRQGDPEKLNLVLTEFSPALGAPSAIVLKVMTSSDDPAAALQIVLQGGVAGVAKQAFLDNTLAYAVSENNPRAIEPLLLAGADANHKNFSGFPGYLLMVAARVGAAASTVKLLHDHGASFDDAIFLLRAQDGSKEDIQKLQLYQEKVTGKKADTDLNEKMQALLAEMLEMKREITTLKKQVARLSRSPANKAVAP